MTVGGYCDSAQHDGLVLDSCFRRNDTGPAVAIGGSSGLLPPACAGVAMTVGGYCDSAQHDGLVLDSCFRRNDGGWGFTSPGYVL